jgi:hypothetical protein
MLTRRQAARKLHCTYSRVRGACDKGILKAERGPDGTHWYSQRDVERFGRELQLEPARKARRPRTAGELAREAYRMLADGAADRELVAELAVTPERATELRRAWRRPDEVLLSRELRARLEQLARSSGEQLHFDGRLADWIGWLVKRSKRLSELELEQALRA